MYKSKVIFDAAAACAVLSVVEEHLSKCSACSKRDTKQCFRDPLLRGLESLKKMETYHEK